MNETKYIYFLGIGGIGMSALARYFNAEGYDVFGYDKVNSPLCAQLEEQGIQINYEDDISVLPLEIKKYKVNTLVVYTPAIPISSSLYRYFVDESYSLKKRAEVLGMVTKETLNLSVAGTHGKTTTSSMVATILLHSDKKFTAFLGGISTNLGSNFYFQDGDSKPYSITEADEFDRSFMWLSPTYTVVTSTDADHLDIYGAKEEIEKSYKEFSELVGSRTHRFYAKGSAQHIDGISYSATDASADYYAVITSKSGKGTHFDLENNVGEETIYGLYLNLPGVHNLENAIGALLMSIKAGVDLTSIKKGLATFLGIKRRFEYVVDGADFTYIDDYAHHPSELQAIILSVRELYPNRKITAVFQPHLFSRTQDFIDDFAKELSLVDDLILVPIYPAREEPIEGVTSEALLAKVTLEKASCIEKEEVLDALKNRNVDVLLTLGAGDIDRLVQPIKELYSV